MHVRTINYSTFYIKITAFYLRRKHQFLPLPAFEFLAKNIGLQKAQDVESATILKKPVITLGEVFYNCLDGVTYCNDISQLPWVIFKRLKQPIPNDEDLVRLCASIYKHSFEGGGILEFYGEKGWLSPEELLSHPTFQNTLNFLSKDVGLVKNKE